MKTQNFNIDWETEIIRESFWAIDPAGWCGYCWLPVVELPCEVSLEKIYQVNREFTWDLFEDMPACGYVKYPLPDGTWVLQRIHGLPFPNEWRKEARPTGLVSLYLEVNPKLKHDKAIFLTEDDLKEALKEAENPNWDSQDRCYKSRFNRNVKLSYERDPFMDLSWDSLGKEEFKNKRAK